MVKRQQPFSQRLIILDIGTIVFRHQLQSNQVKRTPLDPINGSII